MNVVTFGEIMGRLTPPGVLRLGQSLPGTLHVSFAGAEANVAASLARLGMPSEFVTALPKNVLGDACLASLRRQAVGTNGIVRREEGRLGLYFLETGANQRPSQVTYDRSGSTISITPPDCYEWDACFDQSAWLHITGITPALSRLAADSTLEAVRAAKARQMRVSCDLNFRGKLWQWSDGTKPRELAERTMREILPLVDVLIANEADCGDVLNIRAAGSHVDAGKLRVDRYPEVAGQVVDQFPNLEQVAITLRESISASHNNWGAVLYIAASQSVYFAPLDNSGHYRPYEIRAIVDRVGAGDAFAAGLIFALRTTELSDPQTAVRFAVAASCLAHSIKGDFNDTSRAEIEALMEGSEAGRVDR